MRKRYMNSAGSDRTVHRMQRHPAAVVVVVAMLALLGLGVEAPAQEALTPSLQRAANVYNALGTAKTLIASDAIRDVIKDSRNVFIVVDSGLASNAALASQICQAARAYFVAQGQSDARVALFPASGGFVVAAC